MGLWNFEEYIIRGMTLESNEFTQKIYSQTSMAQTSLGPWKFFQDLSSSSHWGLIMVPDQEVNDDNLGESFRSSIQ